MGIIALILVCDDDKEIVEAIRIYLTHKGYTSYKAFNGLEALKVIEAQTINDQKHFGLRT